jgi:hypothetical protein
MGRNRARAAGKVGSAGECEARLVVGDVSSEDLGVMREEMDIGDVETEVLRESN